MANRKSDIIQIENDKIQDYVTFSYKLLVVLTMWDPFVKPLAYAAAYGDMR